MAEDVTLDGPRARAIEKVAGEGPRAGRARLRRLRDVGDPASVDALFELQARFSLLDLLFQHAGTAAPAVPSRGSAFEKGRPWSTPILTARSFVRNGAFPHWIMKASAPGGGSSITARIWPMPRVANSISPIRRRNTLSRASPERLHGWPQIRHRRRFSSISAMLENRSRQASWRRRVAGRQARRRAEPLMDVTMAGHAVGAYGEPGRSMPMCCLA